MTDIFDIDGTPRDATWMAQAYDGCAVLSARIPAGTVEYWKLAAIYCTTGPATLKVEVRRNATTPADNQPVVATWPALDNPSQDIPALPASPHNWAARGVIQRTEMSGLTGFGLSGGKEYDEEGKAVEAYGPWYHAWVLSSVPSDCLTKTGMKGGTEHNGPLHAVFVLTPVPVAYATLREALLGEAAKRWAIELNKDASLQRAITQTGAPAYVPVTAEFDVLFGGVDYVAMAGEHMTTGEVRVWYCPKSDYGDIRAVARGDHGS